MYLLNEHACFTFGKPETVHVELGELPTQTMQSHLLEETQRAIVVANFELDLFLEAGHLQHEVGEAIKVLAYDLITLAPHEQLGITANHACAIGRPDKRLEVAHKLNERLAIALLTVSL